MVISSIDSFFPSMRVLCFAFLLTLSVTFIAGCNLEADQYDGVSPFDKYEDGLNSDNASFAGDKLTSHTSSANPRGSIVVVPAGEAFNCTPTHVWDGDGPVWCAEGPRIRLSGIAARELDNTCSPGHPCPEASGSEARDTLVQLVGEPTGVGQHGHILVQGPTMKCRSDGSGLGSRTAAWCTSPKGGDLSCAMVAMKKAEKWDRYWRGHVCK